MPIRRLCVFCGSSPGAHGAYSVAAGELAREMARRGIGLVYGGGNVGLMGILADAALEAGAEVIGVIPEAMVPWEVAHEGLSELRIVDTMHTRKAQMAELADGFIALPGGLGTFEELCEVLTWSQLGIHRKPCGLLNVAGFFDSFLAMLDHAVNERFIRPEHRAIVIEDHDPARLLDRLAAWHAPFVEKWIDRSET